MLLSKIDENILSEKESVCIVLITKSREIFWLLWYNENDWIFIKRKLERR